MPISASADYSEQHWQDVLLLIKESLADTAFTVDLVSDSDEVGVIQKRIVQNLYDSDLVVCDVSSRNPNVMFELGMRLAFDKPTIIIKDTATSYSFDTSPIEHLPYPKALRYHTIQAFKQRLREKAIATHEASKRPEYTTFLKHFGEFVVASIESKPVSKEDFILEELSQLRRALHELARTSTLRQRVHWSSQSDLTLADAASPMVSPADYVQSIIATDTSQLPELKRMDSEAFKALTNNYLTAAGINALTLTFSQLEKIKRALLGAVNAAG